MMQAHAAQARAGQYLPLALPTHVGQSTRAAADNGASMLVLNVRLPMKKTSQEAR